MYKTEIKELRSLLENGGPDVFLDIGSFVLCTIQNPLSRVGGQIADIKINGLRAKALWGHKKAGYQYLKDNKVALYHMALRAPESPAEATLTFLATPCLGLVKAGFLSQMVGAESGCIDVHNIRLYGINRKDIKCDPSISLKTKVKKVDEYLGLCQRLGGAEHLWNSWCEHVAQAKGLNKFNTAEEVSRYHVEALG